MRWFEKEKFGNINVGDIRTVTKFLILPKCIGNEWRWLETASYQQMCVMEINHASMDYGMHKEWSDIAWCLDSGNESSNVGRIIYSPYFKRNIVITKYINDDDWCFKILNPDETFSRELKANTPLSYYDDAK